MWSLWHAASSRGLHGAVWHQLLLPVVWNQRVDDDFHALSLQRPQYLCLELSGCGHHRAVPDRQEVGAAFAFLHISHRGTKGFALLRECFPSLCQFQGHGLWLLQRLVQAGSRAGQPDLWHAGWHHQSYSHPAGVVCVGRWRPGGTPTARHEGQRPHVNLWEKTDSLPGV